jgi:hypothetical protein
MLTISLVHNIYNSKVEFLDRITHWSCSLQINYLSSRLIQLTAPQQGCQMVYFQAKNLGKFWRVLQEKMLAYFMSIWYILPPFAIFY